MIHEFNMAHFRRRYKLTLLVLCFVLSVDIYLNLIRSDTLGSVKVTINHSLNRIFYNMDSRLILDLIKTDQNMANQTKQPAAVTYSQRNQFIRQFQIDRKARVVRKVEHHQYKRVSYCDKCQNHNFKLAIDNKHVCELEITSPEIDVLLLIFTMHKNRNRRQAIRNTWLSQFKNNTGNVRFVFLLARSYEQKEEILTRRENDVHKDIVEAEFEDSYLNLTYKTLMGFEWAKKRCHSAKYIMKMDDDVYVNIPGLLHTLLTNGRSLKTAVGGTCKIKADPDRKRRSKWYVPIEFYPNATFPGYCSGTGYVTSMDMVISILGISRNIPYFHLEDVYVALCVRKLGYQLVSLSGFHSHRILPTPCAYRQIDFVTSHEVSIAMMEFVWQRQCKEIQF